MSARVLQSLLVGALLLVGCGGFDNAPLRRGVVVGTIAGPRAADAVLSAMEDPSEREDIEEDGSFELDLEPGDWTLFVYLPPDRAMQVPVTVRTAEVTDLGVLSPPPGVTVHFELRSALGEPAEQGKVEILGTPLESFEQESGAPYVTAFPLAPGCYQARVTASDVGEAIDGFCVPEGEDPVVVPITL